MQIFGWMAPVVYFNESQNINVVLDSMTAIYNIKISKPPLKDFETVLTN